MLELRCSENAVAREDIRKFVATTQVRQRVFLPRDLFEGKVQRLSLNLLRDDQHAISITEDQIAAASGHACAFDRDIDCHDLATPLRVERCNPALKNRKTKF